MPTKRKWWSENWQSLVWLTFFIGVAWTTLEYKIDRTQAREIVIEEIKERAYPISDGKVLNNNISHMSQQLTRMETQTKEIKKLIETIHPPN